MYLTRRNQNWLPEVFNTLFDTDMFPKMNMSTTTSPAINVIEKDNEYDVELAAPGMTRDDFKVTLDEEENLVVDLTPSSTRPCCCPTTSTARRSAPTASMVCSMWFCPSSPRKR